MGEAVVAPGTPDAVRHHDPREDRQRGPARRVDLGEGRGGFKADAANRGVVLTPVAVSPPASGRKGRFCCACRGLPQQPRGTGLARAVVR